MPGRPGPADRLLAAVEELGRKIGGAAEVTLEINPDDAQNNGS